MLEVRKSEGIRRLLRESEISEAVCNYYDWSEIETGEVATLDRIYHDRIHLVAVAEIKSRDVPISKMRQWGTGLVSANKMSGGTAVARHLCCPFYVILGCEDGILCWQVYDDRGENLFEFSTQLMKTQRAVSAPSESKVSVCAMLPVQYATEIPW